MDLINLETILRDTTPVQYYPESSQNSKDYLHHLHNLLREDFLGPLRSDLRNISEGRCDQLGASICHGTVEVESTSWEAPSIQKVQLKFTQNRGGTDREIPSGALVFLAERKFIFGILSEQNISNVTLEIHTGEDLTLHKFQLYEYTVYYEAYRHSLSNLLNQKYQIVPLQQFLIDRVTENLDVMLFKENVILKPTKRTNKFSKSKEDVSSLFQKLNLTSKAENSEDKLVCIDAKDAWTSTSYDESQRAAIIGSLTRRLSLIQGPPGTGKSLVGSEIVRIILENRDRLSGKLSPPVLVICQTNSALDQFLEIVLMVTSKIIRIGSRSKSDKLECHNLSALKSHMSQNLLRRQAFYEQEKELLSEINSLKSFIVNSTQKGPLLSQLADLKGRLYHLRRCEEASLCRKADILGLTVTGASKHRELLELAKPSLVMVEEAAEILEAHLMAALPTSVMQLIMIGDHKQLRPATANHELLSRCPEFGVSLFEQLILSGMAFSSLRVQHRMAPAIAECLTSFYPDLVNHESVRHRPPLPGINRNVLFLDHREPEDEDPKGQRRSKSNTYEARMAVRLAQHLLKLGLPQTDIVILSAYSGQLGLVRDLMSREQLDMEADTVDNYQGEEKEVVLLSLVRSGSKSIGFLSQDNRVTVALSRARRGLVMLGNMETLSSGGSDIWRQVRGLMESTGGLVTSLHIVCDTHKSLTVMQRPEDFDQSPLGGCDQECGQEMRCGHVCRVTCHPAIIRHVCRAPCDKKCPRGLHTCPRPCDQLCGPCLVRGDLELPCGHVTSVPCHQRTDNIVCSVTSEVVGSCGHRVLTPCGRPPEACGVRCQELMECGHPCSLPCHPPSQPHKLSSLCQEPCSRHVCPNSAHSCPRKCSDPCPPCEVRVTRQLGCGHEAVFACSEAVTEHECTQRCERERDCGHGCRNLCYEECGPCQVWSEALSLPCGHRVRGRCGQPPLCEAQVPVSGSRGCGHQATVPCHLSASGSPASDVRCDMQCEARLVCGHLCPAPCWGCDTGLHPPCVQPCPRALVCGHPCPGLCGEFCPPCTRRCLLACPHGQCKARCGEECSKCKEKCVWSCPHKRCTKKCYTHCSRDKCEDCSEPPLPCGCVIETLEEIFDEVGILRCPKCGVPISHSFRLRKLLREKYEDVQKVTDIFFAHNMKLSQRKREFLEECSEEGVSFGSILNDKSLSSTKLSMLEVILRTYVILNDADLTKLANVVRKFKSFSSLVMTNLIGVLKGEYQSNIVESLKNIKMYSFESGLWKRCLLCCDIMQLHCDKC